MLTQKVRPIFAIFFPFFLIVQNREWVYWTISCYAYTVKIDWFWASFKMLNLTRVGLCLLVGRIVFKFIINLRLYIPPNTWQRQRGGGGGEINKKKFMQGKMPRNKIHAKKKVKKKNSCRKSESQKSTILPGTIWINKSQLELCFCFKLQLVYLQHTLYTVL